MHTGEPEDRRLNRFDRIYRGEDVFTAPGTQAWSSAAAVPDELYACALECGFTVEGARERYGSILVLLDLYRSKGRERDMDLYILMYRSSRTRALASALRFCRIRRLQLPQNPKTKFLLSHMLLQSPHPHSLRRLLPQKQKVRDMQQPRYRLKLRSPRHRRLRGGRRRRTTLR